MTEKKPSLRDQWITGLIKDSLLFLGAFLLMFAMALIHKDVNAVPALGYWSSFGTYWATRIVAGAWRLNQVAK